MTLSDLGKDPVDTNNDGSKTQFLPMLDKIPKAEIPKV